MRVFVASLITRAYPSSAQCAARINVAAGGSLSDKIMVIESLPDRTDRENVYREHEIDLDAFEKFLNTCDIFFSLDKDRGLLMKMRPEDRTNTALQVISILDAYKMVGLLALEETIEKGSCRYKQ